MCRDIFPSNTVSILDFYNTHIISLSKQSFCDWLKRKCLKHSDRELDAREQRRIALVNPSLPHTGIQRAKMKRAIKTLKNEL